MNAKHGSNISKKIPPQLYNVQCIFSSSVQCNHAQSEWCAMHNYALDWKPSLILCIGSNESLLRQLQVLGVALGRFTTIPIISKIPKV